MHCRHHIFLLMHSKFQRFNDKKTVWEGHPFVIKNFQNFVGFRFPDNYNSIISPIFSQTSQFLFLEKHTCKTDYKTTHQAKDEKWWVPVCV